MQRLANPLTSLLSEFVGQPVAAATTALPNYDRVRILAEARPIQDVELTDQDGHPFQLSQWWRIGGLIDSSGRRYA